MPWNKGIKLDRNKYPNMGHFSKHSEMAREKMIKNHKGNTGKKFTQEHKDKISKAQKGMPRLSERGNKHWNWKGGKSNINKRTRNLIEYKTWRELVYERDDWTCQKCLNRGIELNAYHIINFNIDENLRFNIDNGITFCRKCHYEFHKIFGFNNNNKEQIINYLQ